MSASRAGHQVRRRRTRRRPAITWPRSRLFSTLVETRGGNLPGTRGAELRDAGPQARWVGKPDSAPEEVHLAAVLFDDIGHLPRPPRKVAARPPARDVVGRTAALRRHRMWPRRALMALDDMHGVATLAPRIMKRFRWRRLPDRLAEHRYHRRANPCRRRCLDDMRCGAHGPAPAGIAETLRDLGRGRGTEFNPRVIDAFSATLAETASA